MEEPNSDMKRMEDIRLLATIQKVHKMALDTIARIDIILSRNYATARYVHQL